MALLLTLAMVVTFMPAMAFADSAPTPKIIYKLYCVVAGNQYGTNCIYAQDVEVCDIENTDTLSSAFDMPEGFESHESYGNKFFKTNNTSGVGISTENRNQYAGDTLVDTVINDSNTKKINGIPVVYVIADYDSANYYPVVWHIRCGRECKHSSGISDRQKYNHFLEDLDDYLSEDSINKLDYSDKVPANDNTSKVVTLISKTATNKSVGNSMPYPYNDPAFIKDVNEAGYAIKWVDHDKNNLPTWWPESEKDKSETVLYDDSTGKDTTFDSTGTNDTHIKYEIHVRFVSAYYKLVYHGNNGDPESLASYAVKANTPQTVKSVDDLKFNKTGYHFTEWKTGRASGDSYQPEANSPTAAKHGLVSLFAQWAPDVYNIGYKDQGDTEFSGKHDDNYPKTHTYGTVTTLKGASKDGYTFDGWVDSNGNEVTTLAADTVYTNPITLYAKWTPVPGPQPTPVENFYNVKFDPANGDAVKTESVKEGTPVAQPTKPSRRNFVFEGWTLNGKLWNFSDPVTGDMTLVAKWKPIVKEYLMIEAKDSGKNITTYWNDLSKADYYVLYGNQCGKKAKKLVKTTKNTYTVKKIAGKAPKAHKTYKFYVYAYDKNNKLIDKSLVIHFIKNKTKGKMANVTSITPTIPEVTLKVGEKVKVGAKLKVYKNMKHLDSSHGAQLRFKTDTYGVAKVDKKGNVTALCEGTARIFIQDAGGKYVATVVTVTK